MIQQRSATGIVSLWFDGVQVITLNAFRRKKALQLSQDMALKLYPSALSPQTRQILSLTRCILGAFCRDDVDARPPSPPDILFPRAILCNSNNNYPLEDNTVESFSIIGCLRLASAAASRQTHEFGVTLNKS